MSIFTCTLYISNRYSTAVNKIYSTKHKKYPHLWEIEKPGMNK